MLRILFALAGLPTGLFGGAALGAWGFHAAFGTDSHMDGSGLAGALIGAWVGAVLGVVTGWAVGAWLERRRTPQTAEAADPADPAEAARLRRRKLAGHLGVLLMAVLCGSGGFLLATWTANLIPVVVGPWVGVALGMLWDMLIRRRR